CRGRAVRRAAGRGHCRRPWQGVDGRPHGEPVRRRRCVRTRRAAGRRHDGGAREAHGPGMTAPRPPATESRGFPRSLDALPAVFAFTADLFARQGIDRALLPTVDLAVEELFTNMVKYSTT